MRKTATLNLRVRPEIKAALEQLAEKDGRSLTGLVEWLVLQHSRTSGVDIRTIADRLKNAEGEAA